MYCKQKDYAVKLLKEYAGQQSNGKVKEMHKLISKGHKITIPLGCSPQDKHMVLRVLSQKQILSVLENVLNENCKIRN